MRGPWDKCPPRDGNGRLFLDVNFTCFQDLVNHMVERKTSTPGSPLEITHVGEEEDIFLPRILLVFGLGNDSVLQPKRFFCHQNMRIYNYGSDDHPIAS